MSRIRTILCSLRFNLFTHLVVNVGVSNLTDPSNSRTKHYYWLLFCYICWATLHSKNKFDSTWHSGGRKTKLLGPRRSLKMTHSFSSSSSSSFKIEQWNLEITRERELYSKSKALPFKSAPPPPQKKCWVIAGKPLHGEIYSFNLFYLFRSIQLKRLYLNCNWEFCMICKIVPLICSAMSFK